MNRKWLIALGALLLLPQTIFAADRFSDVPTTDPNYQAIEWLAENGVIEGYTDGTFKPNNESNRAETSKMLLLGLGVSVPEVDTDEIFPDIPSEAWYAKYILEAKKREIVQGNPDGNFYPGNPTNLAEFLKILLETKGVEVEAPEEDPYADVSAGVWYAPYAAEAKWLNLMDQLSTQNIEPGENVTRGEIAQLVYRLMTGYHEGVASYYGGGFDGSGTASGQTLYNKDFVAAHPRFAFDSWVKVTDLDNGSSVNVRIIDRGPYVDGRVIDLSQSAFEALRPLSNGIARVSVIPIEDPNTVCQPTQTNPIPQDAFTSITLNGSFKATYLEGEQILMAGRLNDANDSVTGFLLSESREHYIDNAPVSDGQFEVWLNAPKVGEFQLGIVPGQAGTSNIRLIEVLPSNCLNDEVDESLKAPSSLTLSHKKGDLLVDWQPEQYNVFRLTFTQGGRKKTFFTTQSEFIPPYASFEGFNEGEIKLTIQGATVENTTALTSNESVSWSLPNTRNFEATKHYKYTLVGSELSEIQIPDTIDSGQSVLISADPLVEIQEEAWITFPDGSSKIIKLNSSGSQVQTNERNLNVFPESSTELSVNFVASGNGTHFVEWNNNEGIAALNIPLYEENHYPLLPNPTDFPYKTVELGDDLNALQNQFLNLVNQDRTKGGQSSLVLDSQLSQLAQSRADDMAKNDYFSHWNLNGEMAKDMRQNFGIRQVVSENLAKERSLSLAQYGLIQSPIHRENLLHENWTRAGFGVAKNQDGLYTFVQIFSADPVNLEDLDSLRQQMLNTINAQRNNNLALSPLLNEQAQIWSGRMVNEDFFALNSPSGEAIIDQLRDSGIENTLEVYLVGNTNFDAILEKLQEKVELKSSQWQEIGMGIAQDEFGVIKVTLVYVE